MDTRAKHGCRVWHAVVVYDMSASSVEVPRHVKRVSVVLSIFTGVPDNNIIEPHCVDLGAQTPTP